MGQVGMVDAGQEAREQEHRFASNLIESAPGILYLYDEDKRFRRWNRDFQRATGYTDEEIRAMTPLDFFDGEDRARVAARIDEVFAHGASSVEAELVAKDGTRTPYLFTGRRTLFEGVVCLIGMGVDLTERKRAEAALRASEARYRTTLDGILEGCQLLGFDWRYLYLNEAAAAQNRRPNTELLGRTMPEAWPGIEASPVFALLARCMASRVAVRDEVEFAFPDGRRGWFDVRAQPVPEGIFVLSMDISERKRAEDALQRINQELEARVAERTRDLAAAKERAESADRLKSVFLATMSHELRTPLNSILGFTGILLENMAGPLTTEQSRQLGMVNVSAQHLLALINDILDISRIEAGQLELQVEPFGLSGAIARAVDLVRPLAAKKRLTITLDVSPAIGAITSDRRRVEQILLNLVSNAIKFTDVGTVTVRAEAADQAGRATRISVADTGIGIRNEDLDVLFTPFRQLDSGLGRQREGTGLGLAICKRLVERLGGSIAVVSEYGRGSTFSLTLPSVIEGLP